MTNRVQLTAKDRQLIALLAANARTPIATLAKTLGLSRTTVQVRLKRLEEAGVVEGYGLRLSDSYLADQVRAHVLITIAPKSIGTVCAALERMTAVAALHSVSGSFDLIAILATTSIKDLDQRIDDIGAIEGVERTLSSIILSTRFSRQLAS